MKINFRLSLIFLSIILLSGLGCNSSWADVVEPGSKEITLFYEISNLKDYPEYVFLAHGTPEPSWEVINSSEFSFYKFSQVSIYALKKSDLDLSELEEMDSRQLENFFNSDNRLIPSNINLSGSYGNIAQNNPLEKAKIILEIKSINSNQLVLQKTHIIYYFENGSSESLDFKDQNINPEPSPPTSKSSLYYLVFLFLLVLIVIFLVIIFIFRRKGIL